MMSNGDIRLKWPCARRMLKEQSREGPPQRRPSKGRKNAGKKRPTKPNSTGEAKKVRRSTRREVGPMELGTNPTRRVGTLSLTAATLWAMKKWYCVSKTLVAALYAAGVRREVPCELQYRNSTSNRTGPGAAVQDSLRASKCLVACAKRSWCSENREGARISGDRQGLVSPRLNLVQDKLKNNSYQLFRNINCGRCFLPGGVPGAGPR